MLILVGGGELLDRQHVGFLALGLLQFLLFAQGQNHLLQLLLVVVDVRVQGDQVDDVAFS